MFKVGERRDWLGDGEAGRRCSLADVKFRSCRLGERFRVCFAQQHAYGYDVTL